jgi:hypothetical protein
MAEVKILACFESSLLPGRQDLLKSVARPKELAAKILVKSYSNFFCSASSYPS